MTAGSGRVDMHDDAAPKKIICDLIKFFGWSCDQGLSSSPLNPDTLHRYFEGLLRKLLLP